MVGGTKGNTSYTAMDIDAKGNIILGGSSYDDTIALNKPAPIIEYLMSDGVVLWWRRLYRYSFPYIYTKVAAIKFNPSGVNILIILDKSPTIPMAML